MARSMDEIRELIYAPEPVTLIEKLADHLARQAGYVVITRGTRAMYVIEAEDLLDFIKITSEGKT